MSRGWRARVAMKKAKRPSFIIDARRGELACVRRDGKKAETVLPSRERRPESCFCSMLPGGLAHLARGVRARESRAQIGLKSNSS
mmetsp:Transcript_15692/g.35714  ORF Transcript_15692/g.35714 Transcript_15692/m.35714 type:complete len:85 (+) Transcript_15692:1327-1581(+)